MSKLERANSHSLPAKIIHWGFFGIFIYALSKQLDEVQELEDRALLEAEMVFAALFLLLLIIRFVYMHNTQPTVMPASTDKLKRRAARCVHLGMYLTLSAIAITGLVIGGLYAYTIKQGAVMDVFLVLHELSAQLAMLLIIGHIGASIYHRKQGDGIWDAMVPFWKEHKKWKERIIRQLHWT